MLFKSMNYWAACVECARLVEAEDLEGLIVHAIEEFEKRNDPVSIPCRRHLEQTYRLFFKNRIRISS